MALIAAAASEECSDARKAGGYKRTASCGLAATSKSRESDYIIVKLFP
jgi:hypothetical protein